MNKLKISYLVMLFIMQVSCQSNKSPFPDKLENIVGLSMPIINSIEIKTANFEEEAIEIYRKLKIDSDVDNDFKLNYSFLNNDMILYKKNRRLS